MFGTLLNLLRRKAKAHLTIEFYMRGDNSAVSITTPNFHAMKSKLKPRSFTLNNSDHLYRKRYAGPQKYCDEVVQTYSDLSKEQGWTHEIKYL